MLLNDLWRTTVRGQARAAACLLAFFAAALAAHIVAAAPTTLPRATEQELAWWREARFGLFVHWGPVSLKGTEIGWSRGGERRGRSGRGSIPAAIYDNLYKTFNPVKFNADQWISLAKKAGMRYLVFTTKHHDGFSMFDSALTEYKITNSPFKRDVVAELARACHRQGVKLGFYYSPPDWYHPDYRTENHARYITFLHGQIRELCTNYGKVDILWFDGLGGKPEDWDTRTLIPMIRRLQPGILINNRAGVSADFDTPEQRVGRFQRDRPWESCITICRQWAWKPNDTLKSAKECIDIIVRCAGGDGNLLLNVGPMPTGEIEPRQVKRLMEIGAWLETCGASIYGTRGGPFKPGRWGASTHAGTTVYVHILNWDGVDGPLVLPPIPAKIVDDTILTGGHGKVVQRPDGIELRVPAAHRRKDDTIVVLKLDKPAAAIEPVAVPSDSLTAGKQATASNVYRGQNAHYGPAKAMDDDDGTRWATDVGVTEAWLAVDLGTDTVFERAEIKEAYNRVRRYELQYDKDGSWVAFHRGTRIGERARLAFPPVTARRVRLHIQEATDGPTIWEFRLLGPRKNR